MEESYGPQEDNAHGDINASVIDLSPASPSTGNVPEISEWRWTRPHKSRMPIRSYRRDIFTSVFVPALLLVLLVGLLSAALCLHHDQL
jgi:hypothetical protein